MLRNSIRTACERTKTSLVASFQSCLVPILYHQRKSVYLKLVQGMLWRRVAMAVLFIFSDDVQGRPRGQLLGRCRSSAAARALGSGRLANCG